MNNFLDYIFGLSEVRAFIILFFFIWGVNTYFKYRQKRHENSEYGISKAQELADMDTDIKRRAREMYDEEMKEKK